MYCLNKVFILFTLILLVHTGSAQSNDLLAKASYLKAQEYFGNGQAAEAVVQLLKVKSLLNGTNPRVEQLLAQCYHAQGNAQLLQESLNTFFDLADESDVGYKQMLLLLADLDMLKAQENERKLIELAETPDRDAWKQAQIINTSSGYENYLNKFPNGIFKSEANHRLSILPPTELLDRRDGKIYNIVKIGHQVWMSENLDTDKFLNGDLIPEVKSNEEWKEYAQAGKPAWCYYDNDSANARFGKLYNWHAVNDPRGLAPKGWHIPTDAEWAELTNYLGEKKIAFSLKLADTSWKRANDGNNSAGFSAIPGGIRIRDGRFQYFGLASYWWSKTVYNTNASLFRSLGDYTILYRAFYDTGTGMSVRCTRDVN